MVWFEEDILDTINKVCEKRQMVAINVIEEGTEMHDIIDDVGERKG